MNLFESIMTVFQEKFTPRRRTKTVKRKTKKARRRAHKGTNWKLTKPRKGYKRVKLTGTKRYVFMRLKPTEKIAKRRLMRTVGRRKDFRKK
jgi:hypothetical protein